MIEIAHKADSDSGYGTLVRQLRTGLAELGMLGEVSEVPPLVRDLIRTPRTPRLVELTDPKSGNTRLHWFNEDGSPAVHGTRYRRWVNDHDEWQRPDPRMREAVRVCPTLPRDARWDGASTRVLFTMWESSQTPTEFQPWGPELERADLVLAPSEHSRTVLQAAAPGVPMATVPLALEAERWPFYDRRLRWLEDRPFVFLMVGDLSYRKGWDAAYEAFWRAFGNRRDVVLVLKARGQSPFCEWIWRPDGRDEDGRRVPPLARCGYAWESAEPNVRVLRGNWSRAALLDLYRAADCYVWPTRGEGWGYPPREAAATGLPVITCAHTGQADAADWAYTVPFDPEGRVAFFATWGHCGHIAEPDVDALADMMLWVVANRDEALEFGEQASRVVTRRTPVDLATDVVEVIGSHIERRVAA